MLTKQKVVEMLATCIEVDFWKTLASESGPETLILSEDSRNKLQRLSVLPVIGIFPFIRIGLPERKNELINNISWAIDASANPSLRCSVQLLQHAFAEKYWTYASDLAKVSPELCQLVSNLPAKAVESLGRKDFDRLALLLLIQENEDQFELMGGNSSLFNKKSDPCQAAFLSYLDFVDKRTSAEKRKKKNALLNYLINPNKLKVLKLKSVFSESEVKNLIKFLNSIQISQTCLSRLLMFVGMSEQEAKSRARKDFKRPSKVFKTRQDYRFVGQEQDIAIGYIRAFLSRLADKPRRPAQAVIAFTLSVFLTCRVLGWPIDDESWGYYVSYFEKVMFKKSRTYFMEFMN